MIFHELRDALSAENPLGVLVETIGAWRSAGIPIEEVELRLKNFREVLIRENDPVGEDIVLEAMDFVVGFCHPRNRIY